MPKSVENEKVFHCACSLCHSSCGVLVHVKDGKATKITPDPEHPHKPCPKGLHFIDYVYHPDRVLYPMKRMGEKASGKWERISWEEALDIVAEKFLANSLP